MISIWQAQYIKKYTLTYTNKVPLKNPIILKDLQGFYLLYTLGNIALHVKVRRITNV